MDAKWIVPKPMSLEDLSLVPLDTLMREIVKRLGIELIVLVDRKGYDNMTEFIGDVDQEEIVE